MKHIMQCMNLVAQCTDVMAEKLQQGVVMSACKELKHASKSLAHLAIGPNAAEIFREIDLNGGECAAVASSICHGTVCR